MMTWKTAERAARRQGVVVPGPSAAGRSTPRLGLALLAVASAGVAFAGIARAGGPTPGACTLLTAGDVERVQGGTLVEAISSGNAAEAVATTQCFFRVDPFSSSVSLTLTRAGRGRAAQREVRERWQRLLHPEERQGQSTGRERDRGEKEPNASLTPVAGLGEEAFVAGGRGNVSLYVLAPGAFLRLSVGGPGDAADWSSRVQALARAALARLKNRPPRPPAGR
jgi:hypothetical protein